MKHHLNHYNKLNIVNFLHKYTIYFLLWLSVIYWLQHLWCFSKYTLKVTWGNIFVYLCVKYTVLAIYLKLRYVHKMEVIMVKFWDIQEDKDQYLSQTFWKWYQKNWRKNGQKCSVELLQCFFALDYIPLMASLSLFYWSASRLPLQLLQPLEHYPSA